MIVHSFANFECIFLHRCADFNADLGMAVQNFAFLLHMRMRNPAMFRIIFYVRNYKKFAHLCQSLTKCESAVELKFAPSAKTGSLLFCKAR